MRKVWLFEFLAFGELTFAFSELTNVGRDRAREKGKKIDQKTLWSLSRDRLTKINLTLIVCAKVIY